eukprot:5264524-Amphidinium_carterae.1
MNKCICESTWDTFTVLAQPNMRFGAYTLVVSGEWPKMLKPRVTQGRSDVNPDLFQGDVDVYPDLFQ